ncbi:hypothetical protein L484_025569 [Morus notabilis]|uniref:Myeloid leukemia factor 1 n=1 Tax=Morus notabilis TaxID=981085 RepID=W9R8I3_9ROSA|nr:uncharacterized protein LOC21408259 isoform X2 [Morus notabilis]EXB76215.1 hypothetical protein L484_025569 [Morus notabilis]
MQSERGGAGDFFRSGDPFRGFGFNGSMFPSIFGGRNPFDDPFFSRPFGSLFESSMFGPPATSSGTLERPKDKGVVIQELDSDEEGQEENCSESSKEPSVEHPDDAVEERESNNVVYKNKPYKVEGAKPQNRSFSVHTSKVTYGGVDGAYYTSTRTRREGGDGVVVEETKEADKTTGQAAYRISRGIHDKGHTVTRKLNSDGRVDVMQTLHNLDEGDLAGFGEAWNCNAKGDLPSWKHGFDMHGSLRGEQKPDAFSSGLFLPSSEEVRRARGMGPDNEAVNAGGRTKKVVRINID